MKAPTFTAILTLCGLSAPLNAQNFIEPLGIAAESAVVRSDAPLPCEVPAVKKAQGSATEAPAVYSAQDTITLEPRPGKSQTVESVVDLTVLQQPSPFRNVAAGRPAAETQGIKQDLALISATYRESGRRETSCENIALSVEQRIKLDHSSVLEIVEAEMNSNPSCSCEIVKAAIKAADADTALVVSIVETVITTSPQSTSIASQCAIAAVPESLASVQALLSNYDANAGESGYSSKSAKNAKDSKVASIEMPDTVAAMPNPLDFPGQGPIGPGPGSQPFLTPVTPIITRPVTQVSP
jgi:hypothetical protein